MAVVVAPVAAAAAADLTAVVAVGLRTEEGAALEVPVDRTAADHTVTNFRQQKPALEIGRAFFLWGEKIGMTFCSQLLGTASV